MLAYLGKMRIFVRTNIRTLPIENPQIRRSAFYPRPPLDDTDMSEAALGAEKITSSEKQEKREKISCALCSCTLNSESQAQAHFSGVRHLKLLERHGLPLPEGVNRDKLLVHQRKTYQNGIRF